MKIMKRGLSLFHFHWEFSHLGRSHETWTHRAWWSPNSSPSFLPFTPQTFYGDYCSKHFVFSSKKKTSICWVKVIRYCEIDRYDLTNNTFFYCHISPPLDCHIATKVVGEVVGISCVAYNASLFVCQVGTMQAILYHLYVSGNETVQTMLMR